MATRTKKSPASRAKKKPAAKSTRPAGRSKAVRRPAVGDVNWPLDPDGVPMIQISFAASDLVPTGEYANVTVGPAVATRFVQDGDDDHIAGEITNLAHIVEGVVGAERVNVLRMLQANADD